MNAGIPAQYLIEAATRAGAYYQLSLDLGGPIWVFVNPEYLADLPKQISYFNENGESYGSWTHAPHPTMAAALELLQREGFLESTNAWYVTKGFYFNNVFLQEGTRFHYTSISAKRRYCEYYNDGKILFSPNYQEGDPSDW